MLSSIEHLKLPKWLLNTWRMLEPEKYDVIEIDKRPDIVVEDTDNNNIVTKSTFLEYFIY